MGRQSKTIRLEDRIIHALVGERGKIRLSISDIAVMLSTSAWRLDNPESRNRARMIIRWLERYAEDHPDSGIVVRRGPRGGYEQAVVEADVSALRSALRKIREIRRLVRKA